MTTLKSETVAALKSYLDRVERLEGERTELGDEIRAIYADAKAEGFAPKAIRSMVKRRRAKDPAKLDEDETILETYMHAVGMLPENPLAAAVGRLAVDTLARDQVLAAFEQMVPRNGEIIARVGGDAVRIWRDDAGNAHAEPYAAPAASEKPGKSMRKPATVLTMVPKDSVKSAADAAEERAARKKPADEKTPLGAETDEPVE